MDKKILFLVVLCLLAAGCSSISSTRIVQPTPIISPSAIFISTETSIPLPSETPVILQEVSRTCVEIKNSNSQLPMNGIAIFDNLSPDLVTTIFMHDLESSNLKILTTPGGLWRLWGISPNRKYMMYEYETSSGTDYQLAIADFSGQIIKTFDTLFPNDLWSASYYDWLNEENIRVGLFFESPESSRMSPRTYNFFTGNYIVLKTDFPDYVAKNLDWRLDWIAHSTLHYEGTNLVFDPSVTRVVYPKKGENVSLADVESGRELASIHVPQWGRLPKWSTDGEHLALIATAKPNSPKESEEIYVVQRDRGEFKRLTYLSNTFEQSAIADYAWSPDGTKIAFWSYTNIGDPKAEGTQSELRILDISTGEVTNLCIQGISAVTSLNDVVQFSHIEPIWSPDGNQIMISQWVAPEDKNNKNYDVLVIDLPSLTGIKIDENKQPTSWMTKAP